MIRSPGPAQTQRIFVDEISAAIREAVAEEAVTLRARVARLEAALRQIQKGEGRFSRDQYEFACNVIEEAKETARAALAGDES